MTHEKASADILNPQLPASGGGDAPGVWIARLRARLDPATAPDGPAQESKAETAAVLAPLTVRDGRLHVILTLRPDTLPRHPGQVCFPGGRIHAGEDAAAAALRETHEEIGVAPDQVELLGRWEATSTLGAVRIAPFAGLVDPRAVPRPCPREVADMFAAPLDFLLDPANRGETMRRAPDGTERRVAVIRYGGYSIWGATAAMLDALRARIGE